MINKREKWLVVLIVIAAVINVIGWFCFAGIIEDSIIGAIICNVVSFLIAFPILISFIVSKLDLDKKKKEL